MNTSIKAQACYRQRFHHNDTKCVPECPEPCETHRYDFSVNKNPTPFPNYLVVSFQYEDLLITTTEEFYAFTFDQLFSSLGGTIGLMTGQ